MVNIHRIVCVIFLVAMALARATPVYDDDLMAAASDHGGHYDRVQIKVYRGPSKGYGYHKFAPWGYWVKQPEDDHAKHHGGYHDDGY